MAAVGGCTHNPFVRRYSGCVSRKGFKLDIEHYPAAAQKTMDWFVRDWCTGTCWSDRYPQEAIYDKMFRRGGNVVDMGDMGDFMAEVAAAVAAAGLAPGGNGAAAVPP